MARGEKPGQVGSDFGEDASRDSVVETGGPQQRHLIVIGLERAIDPFGQLSHVGGEPVESRAGASGQKGVWSLKYPVKAPRSCSVLFRSQDCRRALSTTNGGQSRPSKLIFAVGHRRMDGSARAGPQTDDRFREAGVDRQKDDGGRP